MRTSFINFYYSKNMNDIQKIASDSQEVKQMANPLQANTTTQHYLDPTTAINKSKTIEQEKQLSIESLRTDTVNGKGRQSYTAST